MSNSTRVTMMPVERRKEREMDEKGTLDRSRERRGPKPIVIFGAIGAVVILVVIVGYFAFSGGNLDSLAVISPSSGFQGQEGVSFEIETTTGNMGKWSGTVEVEIYYADDQDPVYTSTVNIDDDHGFHEVAWNEFVWGNGEYRIVAGAEGKEEFITFQLKRVVTELEVVWNGNPVVPREEPGHAIEVDITYLFGYSTIPRNPYPSGYELDLDVSPPTGPVIQISSSENKFNHQERIEHGTAGEYSISGTLVNTFCHPGSPYRTISINENSTFLFDAHPFAVVEGDQAVSHGEAANFDAGDSWDDGTIIEYLWDFGDGDTTTTISPTIQHSYTEQGTYTVYVMVVDDKGQESDLQTGLWNLHSITVT
ncbi:MAG: PKD domain-containing protein [Candidatus Thermoplasmatota archaeon]|nr:PKD domain-containing protein [Candidatus Thermoplasmatota archaeon]